jgi:hypothetical protein
MSKTRITVLHEALWQSIAKDAFSTLMLLGSIGIGVWVGSATLQWFGGFIFILWVMGRASQRDNSSRMTIAEARAFLDQIEHDAP